jgi:integrase
MASLYEQRKSPYWWIKFRDKHGAIRRKSTQLRVGVGGDTRKARELCAERSLAEAKISAASTSERWQSWVPQFLANRYARQPNSKLRYSLAWKNVNLFLEERDIPTPRHLERTHCTDFINWRQTPQKKKGIYRAGHNTALLEVKVLSLVMKEAVLRRYATHNPCLQLGIERQKVHEKPEFTDEDIELIRASIPNEPARFREFYSNSLAIARYQGCRLIETHLNPMESVALRADGSGGTITFLAKGGRQHVAPLHRELVPLFQKLIADRRVETYAMPKSPAKMWWNLLTRIGLKKTKPGACFHSLRVTVATRLARSRITETKAMKFIGHASTTVHRSYQRLRPDDLGDCMDALD